jgi:NitT/TauT family transport system permease protein
MAMRELLVPGERPRPLAVGSDDLGTELSGIDALELPISPAPGRLSRLWGAAWPKLAAFGLFLFAWQAVVWAHLKPDYILPGPGPVFERLFHDLGDGSLLKATATTMQRAALGYSLAVAIGVVIGLAVARNRVLRAAVGSMITGLQTMPTIAWFPFAILLFKLSETAILFVIVLGAAPAIANGVIAGVDNIPPLLLRAGRVLGAKGLSSYRHVILPGALPGFVAGLKQGWAFAWRSLMAGEIIIVVAGSPSIGSLLAVSRSVSDAEGMIAVMIVILVIGLVMDAVFFTQLDKFVRRRFGLIDSASR